MDQNIVTLREETGAGVMACKKALEESAGDMEKAKALIAEWGVEKAEKKAERSTGSGMLEAYIHGGRIGVLVEMRCETDFVAKTDEFKGLAHEVAMQIASMDPQTVEELLAQPFIKDNTKTVEDIITAVIGKIGENMRVERFCRYEL